MSLFVGALIFGAIAFWLASLIAPQQDEEAPSPYELVPELEDFDEAPAPMPRIDVSDIDPFSIDFIALDVETANRRRHSICQLGIAVVTSDGIIEYGTLIDPQETFDPQNEMIHGIEAGDVYGAPLLGDVIEALRPILEGQMVVGHSSFDKSAFNAAYTFYRIDPLDCEWRDSINAAKKAWPDSPNYKLKTLAEYLGIEFEHHDALADATTAARIVIEAGEETDLDYEDLLAPVGRKRKAKSVPRASLQPPNGEVVCFTGGLSMKRDEASALAVSMGMEVKAAASKKLTLLVVGDKANANAEISAKQRKVEELIEAGHAIRIVSETEFLDMASRPNS